MPIYDFLSGTWFVLYSTGVICTEYAKYKGSCWVHALSRKTSAIVRETRSETAVGEDAAAEYATNRFNSMIKRISTKLAATNIYYIKLFQAIAYSSDIANEELTSFFRDYTDSVAFTPSEYKIDDLTAIIEYANSVGYVLQIPSLIPDKMGSISLVFYGTISKTIREGDGGDGDFEYVKTSPVVIKYLRANMRERILSSISNFKYLVALLNLFPSLRYLHLTDIYNEQRIMMLDQINFEKETACILTMGDTCKDARCIKIPTVYPEFTAKFPTVIVMERLIGKTLDQLDDAVKDHYCRNLARGLVKTVFVDGLYHCDLHPGNTIFIEDNETEIEPTYKIGLIDFGIVDRVNAQEQEITYELFRSIVKKDADTAVRTLMTHYTEPYDARFCADKDNAELLHTLREYIEKTMVTVVTCFSAENLCFINKLLIKHNLKVARSFTKFELSLSVCDNLCKKLAVKRSYMSHLNEIMADAFE
jgi:predicted unusual protein kinase regulating ubiquinone biosynthesis (AarF/ABC1/UbiB family)